ncbi:hypothetical protein FBUS_05262 [Fasciolopsis buskii]|uniref:Uncharacterized protein n=1 Tax=Fasciolopsis buskii TaxID=27845 RepID=A0A8E0RTY1_9TREM|nr:hypothetical protein FBUS_05262 [Fasciolopsis buski]
MPDFIHQYAIRQFELLFHCVFYHPFHKLLLVFLFCLGPEGCSASRQTGFSCYSEALGHLVSMYLRNPAYISTGYLAGNQSSLTSRMQPVVQLLKDYPLPMALRRCLWPFVLTGEMPQMEVWPYQEEGNEYGGLQKAHSVE